MTSRWWYAVAATLAIVSLVAAAVIGFSVTGAFEGAGVKPVGDDGAVRIAADKQLAVYSNELEHDDLSCAATPDNGGAPVRFSNPSASVSINDWTRVALSPKGTAAGSYALTCTPASGADADRINLGVGNNPEIASAVGRVFGALAVGGLGMLIALTIAIVTGVRRHMAS